MPGPKAPDLELRLVKAAAGGSEAAWQQLVVRFSGLIYSLICRYLPQSDEDERRTVYVDVLESLFEGALAQFDGRATIATWIGVVTRSRCMDHLRREYGRRKDPIWLETLSLEDRELYRLYFLEGYSFSQIREMEMGNSRGWSVDQMVEALDRIEAHLDRTTRRKLAFELEARSAGAVSGRLLEYLAYARQEAEGAKAQQRSDLAVLEMETRETLDRVDQAFTQLEAEEREVMRLRYKDGLTAELVAERLGLVGPRRVYTISGRALRKLRSFLETQEAEG